MRSRGPNRKRRVAVCFVERNALAASYLHQIVERDPCVEILSEECLLKGVSGETALIFVIDVATLSGSLAIYLTLVRSRFPDAKILLLNEELFPDELRRLPFFEVQGFISYKEVKDRLRPALQAIARGDTWFAPELLDTFLSYSRALRSRSDEAGEPDIFTPREKLVVGLVERRLGNKEIAANLHISESTVKFHLSNVFRKLGVRDRQSAAELAASGLSACSPFWTLPPTAPRLARLRPIPGHGH